MLSTLSDIRDVSNGQMSITRMSYRATGTIGSYAAAGAIGGPWGVAAGALVGATFSGGEFLYDDFTEQGGYWNEVVKKTSNGFNSWFNYNKPYFPAPH